MPNVIDEIFALFEARGDRRYGNELVTQLQHALQCASLAEQEDGRPAMIAAALLHDIGHMLNLRDLGLSSYDMDRKHEVSGAKFLARHFRDAVTEPIRLHVPAKRYLTAKDAAYASLLSPGSTKSLELQGGPMDAMELNAFESETYAQDAVQIRLWDDRAKDSGFTPPSLQHYRPVLETCLISH